MKISTEDFAKLKTILLDTYFMARDCDAFFIMENIDMAMSILQQAEVKAIMQKQKLQARKYCELYVRNDLDNLNSLYSKN